ncbi:MAG: CBS domain-containing protein [Solirubrobacterales bacterium]
MQTLSDIELVEAAVPQTATFLEAAEELAARPVPVIAVLDGERAVVGLFGGEELLRGLFPPYLADLRHTAFAQDDLGILTERARTVSGEPLEKHMVEPVTVDAATSALHVAERFLHCGLAAIAVVEDGRFAGMLDRSDFCRAMLRAS